MEFDDVGATLKELDKMDEKLFGRSMNKNELDAKTKSPSSKQPPVDDDEFDNDSDDLADLLNDNDTFSEKIAHKSPIKKPLKEESGALSNITKEVSQNDSNLSKSSGNVTHKEPEKSKPAEKTLSKSDSPFKKLLRNASIEEDDGSCDDSSLNDFNFGSKGVKNSTFLSELGKSSPAKKNAQFVNNETNFLEDLMVNQLSLASSSKNKTDDCLNKEKSADNEDDEDVSEEEDDFLKSLGLDVETVKKKPESPPKKNSIQIVNEKFALSFLDNKDVKSSTEDAEDGNESGLDAYIPSTNAKGDSFSPQESVSKGRKTSNIPRRKRDSIVKQVSFSGIPKIPKFEEALKVTEPLLAKKTSIKTRSSRAEKAKDDTADWLNFLNKTPPKEKLSEFPVNKSFETKTENKEIKDVLSNRRRSSSADWLGITEPNSEALKLSDKADEITSDWLDDNKLGSSSTPKSEERHISRTRMASRRQQKENKLGNEDSVGNAIDLASAKSTDVTVNAESKERFKAMCMLPNDVDIKSSTSKAYSAEIPPKINEVSQQKLVPVENNIIFSEVMRTSVPEQFNAAPISSHQQSYVDQSVIVSLQSMLNNSTLQNEKLAKSAEDMKVTHNEKLKSIENLHREQLSKLEDMTEQQSKRLREEYETKLKKLELHSEEVEIEKKQSASILQIKLDELEKDHKKEIQRLKQLHSESISAMKQDHEDAIFRLKKLKDQEVEAITSSQAYARSLQSLAEQLETRTSELASLQSKIEEKNTSAMTEKKVYLDNKEKDLKALQIRLQKQLEEGDEERTRLQQLVLRLETRLQKYTMEGEEDRWDVQQMKARLSVQQKHLEEEQTLQYAQIEREKEKLRLSQDSLLHEQKAVLLQLAQERQQLTQDKIEMKNLSRRIGEEEARLNVRKLKEESASESQRRVLEQEEEEVHLQRSQLRQESYQIEREKEALQREREALKDEKERFNEFKVTIKRRADEVEEMAMFAAAEREQGRSAHVAARRMETEHHTRLQQFNQQMQLLMDKERQILMEKEKLAGEKQQLESKKDSMICQRCKLKINMPASYLQPGPNPQQQLALPIMNAVSNGICQSRVDPSLFVWYITAQRDQEFLQEELSFLHSLKDSSGKSKNM